MRIYSPQLGRDFSKSLTFLEGNNSQERTTILAAPRLWEERGRAGKKHRLQILVLEENSHMSSG